MTPQPMINFMLERGIYLKPALETRKPQAAAKVYSDCAIEHNLSLTDRTVCVIGYGGSLGIGIHLLECGASRVILQDPYAPSRDWRIGRIDSQLLSRHCVQENGQWIPNNDTLIQVHEDLSLYAKRNPESVDFVVSRSVLEHVIDVEALIAACRKILRPGGAAMHIVNLHDHFPGHPFEMLCYTQKTWRRWLNASNNLNRLRLRDYEAMFQRNFSTVDLTILSSQNEEFSRMRSRIRSEFLTGDDKVDAAGLIRIVARKG